MAASADLRQQSEPRSARSVRPLLLGLFHGRLVAEDRLQLVAHDRRDEQAEQSALHHQYDRMQSIEWKCQTNKITPTDADSMNDNCSPPCDLHSSLGDQLVRVAVGTVFDPRMNDQRDGVGGQHPDVNEKLQEVLLVPFAHAVIYPRAVLDIETKQMTTITTLDSFDCSSLKLMKI